MALDQALVRDRIESGCATRIVRLGRSFVIVLDGPEPAGVVCAHDKRKEFPSREHAAKWLASLGPQAGARREGR
jgi:hypothetical protein